MSLSPIRLNLDLGKTEIYQHIAQSGSEMFQNTKRQPSEVCKFCIYLYYHLRPISANVNRMVHCVTLKPYINH